MRQVRVTLNAIEERRENAADRPGINAAVRMAADAAIDRTGIQARSATNALETFPEWRRQDLRAAVVQDHEVELVGSIQLAGASRSGNESGVYRQGLARGGAGEKLDEEGKAFHPRNDLLRPQKGDRDPPPGRRTPAV